MRRTTVAAIIAAALIAPAAAQPATPQPYQQNDGKGFTNIAPPGANRDGNKLQYCYDTVVHRPLGAIQQPRIHWINRPTFQQAVEIQGRAR